MKLEQYEIRNKSSLFLDGLPVFWTLFLAVVFHMCVTINARIEFRFFSLQTSTIMYST